MDWVRQGTVSSFLKGHILINSTFSWRAKLFCCFLNIDSKLQFDVKVTVGISESLFNSMLTKVSFCTFSVFCESMLCNSIPDCTSSECWGLGLELKEFILPTKIQAHMMQINNRHPRDMPILLALVKLVEFNSFVWFFATSNSSIRLFFTVSGASLFVKKFESMVVIFFGVFSVVTVACMFSITVSFVANEDEVWSNGVVLSVTVFLGASVVLNVSVVWNTEVGLNAVGVMGIRATFNFGVVTNMGVFPGVVWNVDLDTEVVWRIGVGCAVLNVDGAKVVGRRNDVILGVGVVLNNESVLNNTVVLRGCENFESNVVVWNVDVAFNVGIVKGIGAILGVVSSADVDLDIEVDVLKGAGW